MPKTFPFRVVRVVGTAFNSTEQKEQLAGEQSFWEILYFVFLFLGFEGEVSYFSRKARQVVKGCPEEQSEKKNLVDKKTRKKFRNWETLFELRPKVSKGLPRLQSKFPEQHLKVLQNLLFFERFRTWRGKNSNSWWFLSLFWSKLFLRGQRNNFSWRIFF